MKIFNPSLRPACGYVYTSPEGVKFEAASIEKVAEKVKGFRRRAGLPVGDPTKEVNEQLCARYPRMCREAVDPRLLASRVAAWVGDYVLNREKKPVEPEEAHRRGRLCVLCPLRRSWKDQCAPCSDKILKALPDAAKPLVPIPALVGEACVEVGDELSVATQFEQPRLIGLPEHCWRSIK